MLQPQPFPARLTPVAVLSRLALSGLCAAVAVAASTLSANALVAQGSVHRPTVPVIPVANVTARDGGRATVRPTAKPAAKPVAKGAKGSTAAKPAKPAVKLAAKTAVKAPVLPAAPADTDVAVADASVPVLGPVTTAAAGDVVGARAAGYSRYRSTRDSVAGELTRLGAEQFQGLRVTVSLESRELAVLDGADTLLVAPVAIGMDTTLHYGARTWTFDTPRGKRSVLRKNENPIWTPPDWHYAEVANKKGLKLAYLPAGKAGVALSGGRRLVVRDGLAGVIEGGAFTALPTDEEIVFGNTLFVPPLGSKNRQIEGELGRFRLDMGNGYMLHGTPHEDTIGDAATHGCIRLYDEDIEWLFQHVPVGTPVYIF